MRFWVVLFASVAVGFAPAGEAGASSAPDAHPAQQAATHDDVPAPVAGEHDGDCQAPLHDDGCGHPDSAGCITAGPCSATIAEPSTPPMTLAWAAARAIATSALAPRNPVLSADTPPPRL